MSMEPPHAERSLIDSPTKSVATGETAALETDPTAKIRAEIEWLRADNDDLRASAGFWLRLYEAAIQRAIALERELAGLRNHIFTQKRS